MYSKPKLALATITSPLTAFQEIIERRLLLDAVWIVGLAGLLAMFSAIARAVALGADQLFVIGRDNPFTWIGLWMLFSLGVWALLKWMGSQVDYPTVLMVTGWAQVLLVIHQALGIVWGILLAAGVTHEYAMSFFSAIGMVLPIIYVMTVGRGLQSTGRVTFFRGVLSYLLVLAIAATLSDMLYVGRLMAPFQNALGGISIAALRLAPEAAPPAYLGLLTADPWTRGIAELFRLVAGAVGLVLGIWWLAEFKTWDTKTRNRYAAAAGVAGVLATTAYAVAWNRNGYYSDLIQAQQANIAKNYIKSAQRSVAFSKRLTNNVPMLWGFSNKLQLLSDAADAYYQANQPALAVEYYQKTIDLVSKTNVPGNKALYYAGAYSRMGDAYFIEGRLDKALEMQNMAMGIAEKAEKGREADAAIARTANGIGMIYDQQGSYDKAISQFTKAAKALPNFREPWVRMAVTYDRMGRYKDAINSGNHAVKELNSEAAVAWVALAQAFVNTGDARQAASAIAMVSASNKALANKIGPKPEDWKNAVSKLTAQDLKFPLETEMMKK